ncbi:glycosyltransferase [Lacticaseibacillus casei]|jgi:poly(glycerol-phosphate) alpha-glucosyltransferase|uniref:Glycosyltransferase n=1 Tax=Lacticaseibacillus huelsenbergensis TaxID=3035291 RepID=A0ABY8DNQ2_9LACO|nr:MULTISPECIES: glycosyltransferase [Lacticaseibacillus]MDG3061799.1 glycosyltransferase [Lacticaseibacillus sp. BCRC 81376]QVI38104.1 glycosyltransferase [Lacticaseibacillus casei]QXG59919.1 glycosyltransferase [Lacticaseibacillus casei]WFB38608.1 glycosyltransferase [Lacticaseibacillus huelsenbergensis]WFB43033.1 glycosyltransferase [Lacticaseibacillus huelsenbergensis]
MIYLMTDVIRYEFSGIDYAIRQRYRLFKEMGVPVKIISTIYNRFSDLNRFRAGIVAEDCINMNDFFQQAVLYHGPRRTLADLDFGNLVTPVRQARQVHYYKGRYRVVTVTLAKPDSGYPSAPDQIDKIDFFGHRDQLLQTDYYDVRGFLSMRHIFDEDGYLTTEQMMRPDGKVGYENTYQKDDAGHSVLQETTLQTDDGLSIFTTRQELITAFLSRLQAIGQPAYFFADWPEMGDAPLFALPTHPKVIAVRHSAHTQDPNDPMKSPYVDRVQQEIDHPESVIGFVTATKSQAADLHQRSGVKTWAIPPSYNESTLLEKSPVPLNHRKKHTIISVARIHPEKQLDQLIEAVRSIQQRVPDVQLEIYGYVNYQSYYHKLQKQVAEAHLQDHVRFMGYVPDLSKPFDQGTVLALTGYYEGFNLALMQSLAHGMPAVAYDVHYGINEQIKDGQNGFLVPLSDRTTLANRLTQVLTDADLWQAQSVAAKKLAQVYSKAHVVAKWRAFLDDLQVPVDGKIQNK